MSADQFSLFGSVAENVSAAATKTMRDINDSIHRVDGPPTTSWIGENPVGVTDPGGDPGMLAVELSLPHCPRSSSVAELVADVAPDDAVPVPFPVLWVCLSSAQPDRISAIARARKVVAA